MSALAPQALITPDELIAQARQWLGVPFLHQGRNRHGADCLGFLAGCLAELGSTVWLDYLPRAYARNPSTLLIDGLERTTHQVMLQPGAVVVVKFPMMEYASHAAIYTGDSMIHCDQMSRGVVEHGYRMQWMQRTASVWAAPDVSYV